MPIPPIIDSLSMDNQSVNWTASGPGNIDDKDFLFTTLHNYHVTTFSFVINIIIALLGVWIVGLNSLLIETLVRRHAQLDITDMFIYSLAITDAILGVMLLYNSAYNIINFQNRHECLVRFGILQGMLISSTGHISLLTVNRYIKITRPFIYQRIFRKSRMIILSVSVWCFALCFGLLPLLGWNKDYGPQSHDNGIIACRYFGVMSTEYITLNVSLYWVPLLIMAVVYTHVCKISHSHSREITTQRLSLQDRRLSARSLDNVSQGRSLRFTKTVFIIVGGYFFCWLPAGIFFVLYLTGTLHHIDETDQGNILTITTSLGFLNSLLNPIIYAAKIPCVKDRFRQVFCCPGAGTKARPRNCSIACSTASALQLKMVIQKQIDSRPQNNYI